MAVVACGGGADTVETEPPTNPPTNPPTGTSGLDSRPSNTSCLAPDRPSAGGTLTLSVARVFSNLSFDDPIAMMQAPGDASRWFVVQQGGTVRVFPNTATPTASNFVQLGAPLESGGEKGLLGMAFHPDFPTDPRVFLSYTARVSGQLVSRISEFRSTDGGATLATSPENILLTINQPEDNHNGGHIAFGPDGFLYIGIGDGGGGGDVHGTIGNGQNKRTMLGKLLRIAVPAAAGGVYTIPSGNPFGSNPKCNATSSNAADCPEIYAFGLRNPWRWNFDDRAGGSDELWLADVGQGQWEEVNLVTLGGNYGWRCREGAQAYSGAGNCGSENPRIDPVAQYNHSQGVSITGGYVYRGSAIPALQGRYVFGDFGSGNIWHIARNTTPTVTLTAATAFASGRSISSFGQGNDGELYVIDYGGALYRLQGSTTGGTDTIPTLLSATGCVSGSDAKQPATGLIPYAPNAPFWSDSASKDRWIALPNNTTITVQGTGDWDFPNRTVLVKNFRLGTRLIETRLFMRHPDGEWAGYTYEWNDAQTDATRVVGGKEVPKTGLATDWIFPSEAECLTCHTAAAGRSLGIETAQLNGTFNYPQTGRTANQVATHNAIGTVSISQDPATLPAYPDPFGTAGTLGERARSYLHTNCAQCHRPSGGTPVNLDLRYTTALSSTNACNVAPTAGDLGLANARIVSPGVAGSSVLVARMNTRGANQMPTVGSNAVDTDGVTLITNWINGLANCN